MHSESFPILAYSLIIRKKKSKISKNIHYEKIVALHTETITRDNRTLLEEFN